MTVSLADASGYQSIKIAPSKAVRRVTKQSCSHELRLSDVGLFCSVPRSRVGLPNCGQLGELTEPVRRVGRWVEMWFLAGNQFADQFSGAGGHAQPQHVVTCRQNDI